MQLQDTRVAYRLFPVRRGDIRGCFRDSGSLSGFISAENVRVNSLQKDFLC